jgi:lipopolysaccharide/colanic/teichoic acid biosynthesis glycosyltransferase
LGFPRGKLGRQQRMVTGAHAGRRADSHQSAPAPGSKRLLDLVVATMLLVALAPLMLLLAIGIFLDAPGPVFYRCRRVGLYGQEFEMLKLRKMDTDAAGPALTSARDQRFTRVGSFLARTKLDELPQLWNVVRGQMSLVGPRPEDPSFVAIDPEGYSDILTVKGGITGLSQLAFAKESRLLEGDDRLERYVAQLLPQKMALDQLYAARRSQLMDLRILAWTMAAVMFGLDVAVDRRSGRLSVRRRRQPVSSRAPALEETGT